jgi:hypothetical protein
LTSVRANGGKSDPQPGATLDEHLMLSKAAVERLGSTGIEKELVPE